MKCLAPFALLILGTGCGVMTGANTEALSATVQGVGSPSTLPPLRPAVEFDREYGLVFPEDFNAKGLNQIGNAPNGMADDGAALQTAIDAVPPGGVLAFKHCKYYSLRELHVRHGIQIRAHVSSDDALCGIWFGWGVRGLVLDAGVRIDGLGLYAKTRPADHTKASTAAHGLVMNKTSILIDVDVRYFEGDGIHVDGVKGANDNEFIIVGGRASANRGYGLYVHGADANAALIAGLSCTDNARGGMWEGSFLGNTYVAVHTDANIGKAFDIGSNLDGSANRNNHSLFLNPYQEDGTTTAIRNGSIWVGGQGAATVIGDGTVLKRDQSGLSAHHFTALNYNGTLAGRVGSLSDSSTR